jgi:catechol 2,3-dioxygenase
MSYAVPDQTCIGHVHLKVADLERSLLFYRDVLGFTITQRYGTGAVFLSAGGYHHHIGLNTWQSRNAAPAPVQSAGLYHVAILYPTQKDLAAILNRLLEAKYSLTGASDHGVSQALYLNDPDNNGIELYWDRPREEWPRDAEGNLQMVTEPLDIPGLLKLLA